MRIILANRKADDEVKIPRHGLPKIDLAQSTIEVVRGRGIRAVVDGHVILAGNAAYLTESGVTLASRDGTDDLTVVYIAADQRAISARLSRCLR